MFKVIGPDMFEINLFSTQLPLSQILKMAVMPLLEEGKI